MPARVTPGSSTRRLVAPLRAMLWPQVQAEVLRLWRTPSFLVPGLLLPLVLYSLLGGLGKANSLEGGISRHAYALASVATYSIISVMLYSFGVSIANERGQRLNVLMRATPLPASIYLLAKVVTALLSALIILLVLCGFALIVGGVQLSAISWVTLIASLLLGVLPFILLGFAIGNLVNPAGATPIINLSFFILAFASGVFVPLTQLPAALQNIAPYSPFYLLALLAWNAVGVHIGTIGNTVWLLVLYSVIFLSLAVWAYRREERYSFG
ncbi:MAG: ABC transporter permease [Thermogemmatispora sp.]|jgi:ABC-2 type transport system permease protein|uniref:ABC transporter permease n=1 Tax=Thermogemmatispora sp. TaxID=1968838 RepID=UPI0019F80CB8|nr:ABC transporter permease [Thermogemmatispora sp.]MBE3568112.1 ABC transporter permease [Thermogemmatispora sp.]